MVAWAKAHLPADVDVSDTETLFAEISGWAKYYLMRSVQIGRSLDNALLRIPALVLLADIAHFERDPETWETCLYEAVLAARERCSADFLYEMTIYGRLIRDAYVRHQGMHGESDM